MNKFCLTELAGNSLLYDVQGEPVELVHDIYQAMVEQKDIKLIILSAVGLWASKNDENRKALQEMINQVPFKD